jgi:hypothetical protein
MLNKRISTDSAVASLISDVGPLGGLIYTWMLAHLDREGRFYGNPRLIKGMVAPLICDADEALIAKTLAAAEKRGLLVSYTCPRGEPYVFFPAFEKNQHGLRKDREAESDLPAPPDLLRSNSGPAPAEEKEREEKGKEEGRGGVPPERGDTPPPPPPWSHGKPLTEAKHFEALTGDKKGASRNAQRIAEVVPVAPGEYAAALADIASKGKRLSVGLLCAVIVDDRQAAKRSFGGPVARAPPPKAAAKLMTPEQLDEMEGLSADDPRSRQWQQKPTTKD